jgi:hypothetical protein
MQGWSCTKYRHNNNDADSNKDAVYTPTSHYSLSYLFDDDSWEYDNVVVRIMAMALACLVVVAATVVAAGNA